MSAGRCWNCWYALDNQCSHPDRRLKIIDENSRKCKDYTDTWEIE